ncbi:MAG: hypothetical protein K9N35_02260 [Candidatus Marinimicrobia bacterium]|nr:hypothetical protein [Candidatus Neomarinimicrobiota bacterium]
MKNQNGPVQNVVNGSVFTGKNVNIVERAGDRDGQPDEGQYLTFASGSSCILEPIVFNSRVEKLSLNISIINTLS